MSKKKRRDVSFITVASPMVLPVVVEVDQVHKVISHLFHHAQFYKALVQLLLCDVKV
jgi:hypothetical protein